MLAPAGPGGSGDRRTPSPPTTTNVSSGPEVFLGSTGRTISQHDWETRAPPLGYDALTIGLTFRERADLWARIDQRVDQMARDGLGGGRCGAAVLRDCPGRAPRHAGHWLQGICGPRWTDRSPGGRRRSW